MNPDFTKIFALDLGTIKFCLSTIVKKKKRDYQLDIVSIPSSGIKRGMMVNFDDTKYQLTKLINIAEKEHQWKPNNVVVGVSGKHILGKKISVSSLIETSTVTDKMVKRLEQTARESLYDSTREILHVFPLTYRIDDRTGVENPVGFSGESITAEYYIINADRFYLADIIKLCNLCGLKVKNFVSEQYASTIVCASRENMQNGCCVLDIGGGSVDGIIFIDGRAKDIFSLEIGGNFLTKDLAIGLNLTVADAEKVKQELGLSAYATRSVDIQDLRGKQRKLTSAMIYPILAARVDEFATLVEKKLNPYLMTLGSGVILTGGGAECKNISQYLESHWKLPVVQESPTLSGQCFETMHLFKQNLSCKKFSSKFSMVLGLVQGRIMEEFTKSTSSKHLWNKRYLSPLIQWFKEMS